MVALILTDEQLQERIDLAIKKRLGETPPKVEERKTILNFKEGILYLNEIGYKCSASLVYKKTMLDEIPCTKFGRRISFNAKDLEQWVKSQRTKSVDVAGSVALHANQKLKR